MNGMQVGSLPTNIEKWIKKHLFEVVPMAIAIIDREYNLIHANAAFEQIFGEWRDRKCYAAYKDRDVICPVCQGRTVFASGVDLINEEIGYNKTGRLTRYIQHTLPIKDENGEVRFLIKISTDITEVEQIREENRLIFDQVPCHILVIDRDFRIVRTNRGIREIFGDIEGKHCYAALKGFSTKCAECTAHMTFVSGTVHTGSHIWSLHTGRAAMQVTTVPLRQADDSFNMVMEMAVDVTKLLQLEDQLKIIHKFMEALIATSLDGILAVDEAENVTIINPAARRLFNLHYDAGELTRKDLDRLLPNGFLDQVAAAANYYYEPETTITTLAGKSIPVRLVGTRLTPEKRYMGLAVYIQDLREIQELEQEKLEAERLAAVGQTVAGLAHGVKNLINALEGGLYLLKSGISQNRTDRISSGLEMLIRNIERVSLFVREFLSFSKGRVIRVKIVDPAWIVREVVDLYAADARKHGIDLRSDLPALFLPAPLDYEGMHECLTNLVGNALDACEMSENKGGCHVIVRAFEVDETLVFEVIDNGIGMDYEVKQKVFTNFFTTKGLGGTGLGLLTTKKIIQEHGGTIEFDSEPGKGSTFRIRLPRKRLPQPETADDSKTHL